MAYPYKGSKNSIAKEIIDFLPAAGTFVDLFAGGCSVTHAAMQSGKYNKIIINDVDPMPTQLFLDAMNGRYRNERRWISREDFERLKSTDSYVRYCWSFGNNGKDYLYAKEIEEFKHGLHLAVFEGKTELLEHEMELPRGTLPTFPDVSDVSKRYSLYRNYLKGFYGDDEKHIASQAFECLERLNSTSGGGKTTKP